MLTGENRQWPGWWWVAIVAIPGGTDGIITIIPRPK
jgi:hypothetical protein